MTVCGTVHRWHRSNTRKGTNQTMRKILTLRTKWLALILPVVVVTAVSLFSLLDAFVTAAASSQPGGWLYGLQQPVLELRQRFNDGRSNDALAAAFTTPNVDSGRVEMDLDVSIPTWTPSATPAWTSTSQPTAPSTATPTATPTPTLEPTATVTPTPQATATLEPAPTPTVTPSPDDDDNSGKGGDNDGVNDDNGVDDDTDNDDTGGGDDGDNGNDDDGDNSGDDGDDDDDGDDG